MARPDEMRITKEPNNRTRMEFALRDREGFSFGDRVIEAEVQIAKRHFKRATLAQTEVKPIVEAYYLRRWKHAPLGRDGAAQKTVSSWENNQRVPGPRTLIAFAEAAGFDPGWLLFGADSGAPQERASEIIPIAPSATAPRKRRATSRALKPHTSTEERYPTVPKRSKASRKRPA